MRLLILSDLHLEQWQKFAPMIDIRQSEPDAVVLAGDIHSGSRAIQWAEKTFAPVPVLYVHGNHEAYGSSIYSTREKIATACDQTDNVHFLDASEHRIADVRFLGATLWTDFNLFGERARPRVLYDTAKCMSDYRVIKADSRKGKLKTQDTEDIHVQHREWLRQKLSEPFDGKTVVITHMAPSIKSIYWSYLNEPCSGAFASNCEDLVIQADVWVHGHTHTSFDYRIEDCRVVCNPLGYRFSTGEAENLNFDPNFIVTI